MDLDKKMKNMMKMKKRKGKERKGKERKEKERRRRPVPRWSQ